MQRTISDLSAKDWERIQEAVLSCNKDNTDQVERVIKILNLDVAAKDIINIFHDLQDCCGDIDFEELVQMANSRISISGQKAELEATFKIFDKDGDGLITFPDLKQALTELGEEVTDDDVREMIREADKNQDGAIDLEEFTIMMTQDQYGSAPNN